MKSTLTLTVATLCLVACLSAAAQGASNLFWGSPVPVAQAGRSIVINPDTRWVNVAQGETIRFVAGSVEFGWKFDGPGSRSFDLAQVLPAGAVTRPITVYVAGGPGHRQ